MTCLTSLEYKYCQFIFISSINCLSNLYYSEAQDLSFETSCHIGLLAQREGSRPASKRQAEKQLESD